MLFRVRLSREEVRILLRILPGRWTADRDGVRRVLPRPTRLELAGVGLWELAAAVFGVRRLELAGVRLRELATAVPGVRGGELPRPTRLELAGVGLWELAT
ncbi:hypothetical protein AB0F99_20015, partial [Nocardia testacea]